ncbi:hypothetical protein MUO98_06070, partial [Candidatus Bathyarchaeota archaeon]|nr:hypothetical protein [Candidatus Bathyarchaeota archaeon]
MEIPIKSKANAQTRRNRSRKLPVIKTESESVNTHVFRRFLPTKMGVVTLLPWFPVIDNNTKVYNAN